MKTTSAIPIFQVSNVDASLKHYTSVFGFVEDFRFDDYAGVKLGDVRLHLSGHGIHERPIGGGTAFPIHVLRDTYQARKPGDRPVHILIISDDGVTTLFANDERGASGWDISRMALQKGGGGGSMLARCGRHVRSRTSSAQLYQRPGSGSGTYPRRNRARSLPRSRPQAKAPK